jgi:hypothetical protein
MFTEEIETIIATVALTMYELGYEYATSGAQLGAWPAFSDIEAELEFMDGFESGQASNEIY